MLDSTAAAAVDRDYFWRPMTGCPAGAKVQLLNAGGVAVHGRWNGRDDHWLAWAPLPKVPGWMREGEEK